MGPLPAIDVPWTLKPLESASTAVEVRPDGRMCFSIRHDLLRGVTPEMLVWWFQHLEGDMMVAGKPVNRYRAWHPRDHHSIRYARRLPDGSVGVGARIHICEFFGARPENKIDVVATIERLDTKGFVHSDHVLGVEMARMSYRFEAVAGGTLYENELVVGTTGVLGPWFNRRIRPRIFPDDKGRAWQLHNIEEVGAFEHFLPALYDSERGR
jgi:hypothetical protein